MPLFLFLVCTDRLDLVGVLDSLVQNIDLMLSLFICGLAVSLLSVGYGAFLEHAKGAYLVII